ncbi:hypothetical protein Btru_032740 [Bulinus truncatus]|nr:hypothetical protein Btru_032740 [Bulinus truncatus]
MARSDLGNYTASYGPSGNCTVSYTAPPLVLDMVKSQNLEKGNDLDILCDVKGFPGSVVTWTRDGVELTENTTRVNLMDNDMVKNAYLHIKSLDYSDEGLYNCTAYSSHFNKSHSKSLVVRVKNPIAWVWPLVGIIVEVIFLAIIIFACAKFDKRRLIQSEQNDLHHNEGHGTRKHGDDKTD